MDKSKLDDAVRNAMLGVALEVRRIRQAMWRLEQHLVRMDKVCGVCDEDQKQKEDLSCG
jgi:hypothetical protein